MTWARDRNPLPRRAQRMIRIGAADHAQTVAWARTVFAAIATAADLDRARRLAILAIPGIEAGTTERAWLSDLVENPQCHGFCKQCSKPFNGTAECLMDTYAAMCPRQYSNFADGVMPVAYAEAAICGRAA